MKRVFNKKLLIFAIVFAVFMPVITYALGIQSQGNTQEQKFFYADKLEASPGDIITMSIDLSEIDYEDFEFSLTSSNGVNDVSTTDNTDVNIAIDGNEFKIISNKSSVGINKIDLYYQIPENAQINSTITFVGTIKEHIISDELSEAEAKVPLEEVKLIISIVNKEKDNNQLSEDSKNEENEIMDDNKSNENFVPDDKSTINNNLNTNQASAKKQVSSEVSQMNISTMGQSNSKISTSEGTSTRRDCYL